MDELKLILAAICEEFFFRGFLLDLIISKYKVQYLKAALGVSLVFALSHFVNGFSYGTWEYVCCQVVFALGISMLLCWLYIERKSIIPCIILHGLINVQSLFSVKINEQGLAYITMGDVLAYGLLAFLCFGYSSYKLGGMNK